MVDESDDLSLFYILPKNSPQEVVNHVNSDTKALVQLPGVTSRVHSKRLLVDIKRACEQFSETSEEQHGIRVEVDDTVCSRWTIYMNDFPSDTLLFKDMKMMGFPEVVLRAEFPEDYPFSPPFIRVLSPRFERWTGHVTYGGSLCAEFLTLTASKYSWEPVLSISTVLLMVKELLALDGRLDRRYLSDNNNLQKQAEAYSEAEAKEAFQVALKKHGWQA